MSKWPFWAPCDQPSPVSWLGSDDATWGLFMTITSDHTPHPAYCLISWHHNCDKFYRESREYSDQDTRNLTAPRLFFTSLNIIPSLYTLQLWPRVPWCITDIYIMWEGDHTAITGVWSVITLTMCYQASGYQHNHGQESRCQDLDASFPSGPPLIVRGPSQCSSYFNNSPTPGVYCVKYPQIHAAVNPVCM